MKTSKDTHHVGMSRRQFVTGVSAGSLLLGTAMPLLANAGTRKPHYFSPQTLLGKQFDLSIGYQPVNYTGTERLATTINGSVPAPVLRWKEGETVTLRVKNNLAVDSSIHWHGLILPSEMDGVPGLSFDGIKPGETFEYSFDINQSGTYWYHSHSGFQEQTGMYGAIVIDPKDQDPVTYDRDYVVVLSDWSDEQPEDVYAKLKKMSHYYNFRERTMGDLWRDIKEKGVAQTWREREMWNQMRMSETDISDVTGYTYTFLMNGNTPDSGWLGLFKPKEKIRLRFVNAAAMTIFDVRIPGLKMKVVSSDGQNIDPVSVDEFRIGVAETYDVIVEPDTDSAYTVFAQSIDRTGYARGTLTSHINHSAEIPAMDPAPVLAHRDMGMNHAMHEGMSGKMDHAMHQMSSNNADHQKMDHSMHQSHQGMQLKHQNTKGSLGKAGFGSNDEIVHAPTEFGPHIDMRSESPMNGLYDPGIGLRNHAKQYGRKVLTYADICNYYPTSDPREPSREIQLHLTGNMSRYMWSVDGIKFADAEPIQLKYGERVRITLVNDTMMTHPIHLHGVWSELETGDPKYIPKKHTILVQPGSKISYLVTADARGRWAYHCHLLFHMPGMMREVRIS
ncbi:MAG: copper resistance system multicopper oxidase [Pseudomonadales bacterium]|nr:copper resistance system multicopper oxidase [Pseudomonadales bacterium]